jgi:hypothetical protein
MKDLRGISGDLMEKNIKKLVRITIALYFKTKF